MTSCLVIKNDGIGDLILASGLVSALGEHFGGDIDLVTCSANREVAEGIELPEQENSLHDLGCEIGQGFLFARPMDSGALFEFLSGRPEWTDAGSRPASNAA